MCEISVPGEMSTPRVTETGALHGSILSILQSVGKQFPPVLGAYQALFADDACVDTTDVFRKIAVSYFK